MSASTIPVTLPCFVTIGDCAFDVDAEVKYNQIGRGVCIESITLNGSELHLEQGQYEELADEIRDHLLEGQTDNDE